MRYLFLRLLSVQCLLIWMFSVAKVTLRTPKSVMSVTKTLKAFEILHPTSFLHFATFKLFSWLDSLPESHTQAHLLIVTRSGSLKVQKWLCFSFLKIQNVIWGVISISSFDKIQKIGTPPASAYSPTYWLKAQPSTQEMKSWKQMYLNVIINLNAQSFIKLLIFGSEWMEITFKHFRSFPSLLLNYTFVLR